MQSSHILLENGGRPVYQDRMLHTEGLGPRGGGGYDMVWYVGDILFDVGLIFTPSQISLGTGYKTHPSHDHVLAMRYG